MSKYSFLERGRNNITEFLKDKVSLSFDELEIFRPIYDHFILEMKEDDEEFKDPESLFVDNGYLSFDEVINKKKADYFKSIVKDFLFVEFCECFFNGSSKLLITQMLRFEFEKNSLILEIGYIERK